MAGVRWKWDIKKAPGDWQKTNGKNPPAIASPFTWLEGKKVRAGGTILLKQTPQPTISLGGKSCKRKGGRGGLSQLDRWKGALIRELWKCGVGVFRKGGVCQIPRGGRGVTQIIATRGMCGLGHQWSKGSKKFKEEKKADR